MLLQQDESTPTAKRRKQSISNVRSAAWSPALDFREVLRFQSLLESIGISVLGDEGGDLPNNAFLHPLRRQTAGRIDNNRRCEGIQHATSIKLLL